MRGAKKRGVGPGHRSEFLIQNLICCKICCKNSKAQNQKSLFKSACAVPKREVSDPATGANSLFKTWFVVKFVVKIQRLKIRKAYLNPHARTQKERCRTRPPERIPYLKLDLLSRFQGAPASDNPRSANPGLQPHTFPVNRIPGGHPTSLKLIIND